MIVKRQARWVVGCSCAVLSACAHRATPPLPRYDLTKGYRFERLAKEPTAPPARKNSDDVFVVLAFSGGGTRAASLSTGVLYELASARFHLNPQTGQPCTPGPGDPGCETTARSLLDEVDVISSVSGGSFAAAYYALNGSDIFNRLGRFQKDFLYYPLQRDLFAQAVYYPQNWRFLGARAEIAAHLYDTRIFDGATYARLEGLSRPYVILNGTDATTGARFEFSQEQFDLLCSDLSRVPLARGVTGSSAFPGLLNSIAIDAHDRTKCGYAGPGSGARDDWVPLALQDKPINLRRYRAAQDVLAYRDPKRTTLHVLDGGLADNIGLRAVIQALASSDQPVDRSANARGGWSLQRMINDRKIKTLVVITVNARTKHDSDADAHAGGPSTIGVLGAASGIPMGNYSTDTLELLQSTLQEFADAKVLADLRIFTAEIAFEDLPDNADPAQSERHFFDNLATSFELQPYEVDCLIDRGERLLKNAPNAQFGRTKDTGKKTFADFVTTDLKGEFDPVGGPHPAACNDNAAKKLLGIRTHYIDVGVEFGSSFARSGDIKSQHGPGLAVRVTRPNGLSAIADFGSQSFDVRGAVNGANLTLGAVGLRTLTGGLAYTRRVAQLEATAGFAVGYGFGHFDVDDATREAFGRQGVFGLTGDATNAVVLSPRVSLWQNLSSRWALGATATYVHARPTVQLTSGPFVREQTVDATAIRVSAGIGFKVF